MKETLYVIAAIITIAGVPYGAFRAWRHRRRRARLRVVIEIGHVFKTASGQLMVATKPLDKRLGRRMMVIEAVNVGHGSVNLTSMSVLMPDGSALYSASPYVPMPYNLAVEENCTEFVALSSVGESSRRMARGKRIELRGVVKDTRGREFRSKPTAFLLADLTEAVEIKD